MRFVARPFSLLLLATLAAAVSGFSVHRRRGASSNREAPTLCAAGERIIFSCLLRQPAKVVSVCASKDLTNEKGYLQYRFGLPAKIELEFPKDRANTQQQFEYSHYFRARFDMTEINFTVNGVSYSVFDDYNGEEKPEVSEQGVTINWPGTNKKDVRYLCASKLKADYADLEDVLREH
jgi:hypothetical protein